MRAHVVPTGRDVLELVFAIIVGLGGAPELEDCHEGVMNRFTTIAESDRALQAPIGLAEADRWEADEEKGHLDNSRENRFLPHMSGKILLKDGRKVAAQVLF